MKNLFKKISAILIAAVMVLAMASTAFAADETNKSAGIPATGTAADKGKITVKGVEDEKGKTIVVTAYQIVTATYGDKGQFTGYNNLYNITDIENPTVGELSAIAASTNLGAGTALQKQTDGSYAVEGMPVGMYLICVTGAEAHVYNVAVASINYENSQGQNVLVPGDVTMVTSGSTWVKKSDAPGVKKKITTSTTITDNGLGGTANIGSEVSYEVEVNPIPNYSGNFPKLNVVDTLSEGLDYVADSLSVKIGATTLVKDTDYTLSVSGRTITVDFVVGGTYKLNNYVGNKAVITYKAKVNSNAKVNAESNNNRVVLNYTKDSKTNGNDGSDEKKTYTYTFEIDGSTVAAGKGIVTKKGEEKDVNDNNKPLPGAEFTLYTDEACEHEYINDVFKTGKVTSDDDGQLHIKGLAAGTYYLKETKAPTGYSINTKVYAVVITASYTEAGQLTGWTVTIDGNTAANFTVEHNVVANADNAITGADIQNTKLNSLPSTGGMGTYLFTIIGVVVMAGAAGAFFISRRKGSEE